MGKWISFLSRQCRVLMKPGGAKKQLAYLELLNLEEVKAVCVVHQGCAHQQPEKHCVCSTTWSPLASRASSTKIVCMPPVVPDDWQLGNKVSVVVLWLLIHIANLLESSCT